MDQEPISNHFLFSDRNLQKDSVSLTISFTWKFKIIDPDIKGMTCVIYLFIYLSIVAIN